MDPGPDPVAPNLQAGGRPAALVAQLAAVNPVLAQLALGSPLAPHTALGGAGAAGGSTPQRVFADPVAQLGALDPLAALAAADPLAALSALSPALRLVNPAVNPAATLLAFAAGLRLPFAW